MSSDTDSREQSPFSGSSSDVYLTPADAPSPSSTTDSSGAGLARRLDGLDMNTLTATGPPVSTTDALYPNLLSATSSWASVAARASTSASSINTATVTAGTLTASPDLATAQSIQPQSSSHLQSTARLGPRGRGTLALFQEACSLHKYSRPHDIGWIVERPERLRAIKTGVAAALARLEAVATTADLQWQPRAAPARDDAADIEHMLGAMAIADAKPSTRDIVGGPFDICFSSATLAVDDPALAFIHPLPNLPPSSEEASTPSVTLPVAESSRPAVTPSASPSKLNPFLEAPASAPPKLASNVASGPEPWPKQLSALCRSASKTMAQGPHFSEIPAHLPQGDLYLTEQSEQAIFGALGAVCEAVDRVVDGSRGGTESGYDRAFVAIRPPGHHCCEAQPMGFCFVNNVAVAAAHAHQKHGISRVVVLDIDLHHGNGTQEIAWRINSEANQALLRLTSSPRKASPKKATSDQGPAAPPSLQIFYGSLHDIYSYPCEDGDMYNIQAASINMAGGHSQWISNIHLDSFDDETDFYQRLYPQYRDKLLGAAREFVKKTANADAAEQASKTLVIISAGFDASEHESAGMSRHRRNVPTSFFHRFTTDACDFANEVASGKLVSVLEGGYSDRALASGVLGMMTALVTSPRLRSRQSPSSSTEVSEWWSEANLAKLEKACKTKRGKLAPWPTSASSAVAKDERWLSRTVDIMSKLESVDATSDGVAQSSIATTTAKAKKEPPQAKTMQLRERRSRANLKDERTPQASPARGSTGTNTRAAAAAAPPVPPMPVFGGRAFETTATREVTSSAESLKASTVAVERGEEELRPAPIPKIKFKWGAGGV
ncbi:hypothetical protein ACM66B_000856 [Microbotryomycetes sp. NB124-2]